MTKLEKKLFEIASDKSGIDIEKIEMKSMFVDDLGCDSLDMIEMVMEIEDVFDIEFPDEDYEKIVTVQDAYDYLEQKVDVAYLSDAD